ncbi:hypothetical protein [Bacteroides sp. 44_46]|uniref:hypothetical protein n=1 Tax=Bacteroides sp. 44_46 TaxID=1897052 RepID=UPI000961C7A6|nr:hypothetical protein [Bacteroides sp. 44_46]OKZ00489.1 MAG: hypothetical protein BHV73_07000 [Bacteroides sp. 44_46]
MKKRVSKILWFGDALDENHQAIPPALSPSDEEHLQGLNLGEIYICVADADPALFIRTSADRIVYFKALDIEALSKFFIRKDRPDEAGFLIKFLGGLFSDYIQSMNFSSGALGEGFVIKVDSKTGKSYIEVDELFVRIKAMFSELEIKKLSYAGGNYMFTAAGMKCGKVEEHEDFWRCYLLVDDGETAIENPFNEGDQVRFQDFNIKPGVYENVSNRYYWRLCVGVGEDYIDLSKTDCDANSDTPQEGDSLVQLGNRTDKKRQNAITLSVYGDDAPSIHQYAGIDSYSMAGKEVTVISPQGNKFMGDFILKTGINIMTQFKILEDLIYSEISKVLDEIQAEDNYLYNSAFASNTNGWEAKNDIHFFTVNGKFLLVNGKFYSRKDAMVAIIRDEDRNVLRILSSGIKQSNADLANKPTYEEGEEPRKFFISFKYKVITAGTLTIGFPGQSLHFTEQLEPGEEYTIKEYSGTWDGTGDFELKFTGDIYIHSLALAENAFEDLYTKLSSEIKQTAESIRLEVKELSESNNQRFSQIEQRADSIELSVTKIEEDVTQLGLDINGVTDELKLYVKKDGLGSEINVALDNISVVSKNIYFTGDISANGNVSIQADGTIKAIGGEFSGELKGATGEFNGKVSIANNKILLDSDGSGHLANGNINWNKDGNLNISGSFSTNNSGGNRRIFIGDDYNESIGSNEGVIKMYNDRSETVFTLSSSTSNHAMISMFGDDSFKNVFIQPGSIYVGSPTQSDGYSYETEVTGKGIRLYRSGVLMKEFKI